MKIPPITQRKNKEEREHQRITLAREHSLNIVETPVYRGNPMFSLFSFLSSFIYSHHAK